MRVQGFKVLDNPTKNERIKALRCLQYKREFIKLWCVIIGSLPFLQAAYPWVSANGWAALGISAAGLFCTWKVVTLAIDALLPNGVLWRSGDCLGLLGPGSRDIEIRAARALYVYTEEHFNEPYKVVAILVPPERWHDVPRIASVPAHHLDSNEEAC